jgi:hypothetical protein
VAYAYYRRLNRCQQAVYRRSDEIDAIPLIDVTPLQTLAEDIAQVLTGDNQPRVQALSQRIADALTDRLRVPVVRLTVLAVRPHNAWGELHGFYRPAANGTTASIVLWMRTAQRKRVVAFRTYLRTLLHELCHHFDYTLFELGESFHTLGFYRRESNLMRQLVPGARLSRA